MRKIKEMSLERFLWCLEGSYGNCKLEEQEVEYIGREEEFIEKFQNFFGIKIIIPEEGIRSCCDEFYKKWGINHK